LDIGDIDWEKKEVCVVNAKSKDIEMVYFTDHSLFWLKKYMEKRKDDLPHLFVSGRGRLLTVTSRNYMRTHLDNIGIKKHIKHHICQLNS
jgi:integrase